MPEAGHPDDGRRPRKHARAVVVGAVVAVAAAVTATATIGWPAPGISIALGFGAYWIARKAG